MLKGKTGPLQIGKQRRARRRGAPGSAGWDRARNPSGLQTVTHPLLLRRCPRQREMDRASTDTASFISGSVSSNTVWDMAPRRCSTRASLSFLAFRRGTCVLLTGRRHTARRTTENDKPLLHPPQREEQRCSLKGHRLVREVRLPHYSQVKLKGATCLPTPCMTPRMRQ